MTLQECINDLNQLDPYDILNCGLDNFSPHVYVKCPKDLQDKVDQLSDTDRDLWDEHTEEYIRECQGY